MVLNLLKKIDGHQTLIKSGRIWIHLIVYWKIHAHCGQTEMMECLQQENNSHVQTSESHHQKTLNSCNYNIVFFRVVSCSHGRQWDIPPPVKNKILPVILNHCTHELYLQSLYYSLSYLHFLCFLKEEASFYLLGLMCLSNGQAQSRCNCLLQPTVLLMALPGNQSL